jgi:hypothetical protein
MRRVGQNRLVPVSVGVSYHARIGSRPDPSQGCCPFIVSRRSGALHPLPVIFIRRSTDDTDLIVLSSIRESWPSKPMRTKFSDESL